jgi:hypothetical protein
MGELDTRTTSAQGLMPLVPLASTLRMLPLPSVVRGARALSRDWRAGDLEGSASNRMACALVSGALAGSASAGGQACEWVDVVSAG